MATRQKHHADQAKEAAQKQRTEKPAQPSLVALTEQAELATLQRAIADPRAARPADILALQRTVGNRAVTRLIQPKLTIGPTGDQYEQEADRVADQVASMGTPTSSQPVQLQAEEEEEEEVQAKSLLQRLAESETVPEAAGMLARAVEGENDLLRSGEQSHLDRQTLSIERDSDSARVLRVSRLHRDASQEEQAIPVPLADRIQQSQGQGGLVSPAIQHTMSTQLGYDFSHVRVKADGQAAELAQQLGARAFTHGSDIWLGHGESANDTRLMAHELTHVAQQRAASKIAPKRKTSLDRAKLQSDVLTHLQAVLKGGPQDASVYRQAIQQFQRENTGDKLAALQRKILEAPAAGGIGQKDKTNSVRLAVCGGGGAPTAFPTIGTITGDSNVKAARSEAWTAGEGDYLERSGWVMWKSDDDTFEVVNQAVGDENGVNPGPTPADTSPTYCVGHYHTHPPLSPAMKKERKEYYKKTKKEMYPVAPSGADRNFANGRHNPGVVKDFIFASRWPSWLTWDYEYGPQRRPGAPAAPPAPAT
jgi:hypothetical protein